MIARSPSLWSKTTLITGSVGGAGEDPPTCEMGNFSYVPDFN